MRYYLSRRAVLKWLETPSIYQINQDDLYELDHDSFSFLKECASEQGCVSKNTAFADYCLEEGLLTTEPVLMQRPPLVPSPQPSLRYFELQITDQCNLRCKHCYIGDESGHELTPEQVRSALTQFQEMQGLRLLLTGGEPLLHSKFNEINEMLPEFLFRKVLFTNGMLLTKDILKTLKVEEVQISIDGLEEAHDSLRGSGSFQRSREAIGDALNTGFDVSISTMVHRGNLSDFDAMERLWKDLGIKDWTVDVPCPTGRLKEHPELYVTPEEGGKYLGYGYGEGLHSSGNEHGCGLHLMAMMANGAIAKCTFYADQAVGTLADGLRATWQRVHPIRLKDLSCNCEYLDVCRGGCRYRAELMEGKRGRDLYRCMLYGII
jgi:radical SAM protein with 4Fe4S-binding SPASM domain